MSLWSASNDEEAIHETELSDGTNGSKYSDTEDRRARKRERKPLVKKRKTHLQEKKAVPKQSKRARLKEKTSQEKSDMELFGGKENFAGKT
jgi:hypothetical protein